MRDNRILIIGLVVVLLAVGVVIVFVVGRGPAQVAETIPEPTVAAAVPETEAPQEAEQVATIPPTEGEVAQVPELKTELTATDPSTVSLASGGLQLVEVFAFW